MQIVRMNGGLGNQMFQYAFGYYLKEVGNDVCFDLSDYSIHHHHQGYELEKIFDIHVKEARNEDVRKLCGNKHSIFIRMFRKMTGLEVTGKNEIVANERTIFIIPTVINNSLYFNGFWQNIQYVKPYIQQLKKIFSFQKLDDVNKKFIENKGDSIYVGVHIRRGDYLKTSSLNGICNFGYYESAINYIKEKVDNPKFVVFSDDISWCKTAFEKYDCIYVDWNTGKKSYRDMQLMSLCDHMIIANSTFSWWGAMLMENESGIKIAPSKWDNNSNDNSLIDDTWITIDIN